MKNEILIIFKAFLFIVSSTIILSLLCFPFLGPLMFIIFLPIIQIIFFFYYYYKYYPTKSKSIIINSSISFLFFIIFITISIINNEKLESLFEILSIWVLEVVFFTLLTMILHLIIYWKYMLYFVLILGFWGILNNIYNSRIIDKYFYNEDKYTLELDLWNFYKNQIFGKRQECIYTLKKDENVILKFKVIGFFKNYEDPKIDSINTENIYLIQKKPGYSKTKFIIPNRNRKFNLKNIHINQHVEMGYKPNKYDDIE